MSIQGAILESGGGPTSDIAEKPSSDSREARQIWDSGNDEGLGRRVIVKSANGGIGLLAPRTNLNYSGYGLDMSCW